MIHLSGSSLERASVCIGSAVFPHSETVAAAATRGSVFHDFLFNVRELGIPAALEMAPVEYRANLMALDFDRLALDPARYAGEVAFAYDTKTGGARELGRGLTREEVRSFCTADEIPGTADVVSLEGGNVLVLDYKTGWTDYGPTKLNWQLSFYALCAARAYGCESARVGIVRIREDGSTWLDMAELDFFDLEDFAFKLDRLIQQESEARAALEAGRAVKTRMGEHCRRCAALGQCPAMGTLARNLVHESTLEGPVYLHEGNVREVYERARAVRTLLERVEFALEAWAESTPIELGDGRVFGKTKLPRDVFDVALSEPALIEMFGPEFAQRAIDTEPRITKDGLRRALRLEQARERSLKVEPALKTILGRLRETGGMSTKFSYPVRAHKPKPDEVSADDGRQNSAGAVPRSLARAAESRGGDGALEAAGAAQG